MKTNRLSHSACSKYQTCPKSYDYHYNQRLRPKYQSGALFFGSAVDAAINTLLKDEGKDPYEVFDYNWRFGRLDGQEDKEFLPESLKIVYSNNDYDKDLLNDEDIKLLYTKTGLTDKESVLEYYKTLSENKKNHSWDRLNNDDKKLFNYYNWLSLLRKGHLMIKTFNDKIKPMIVKVHAVQKYIKLQNSTGDTIIGYIDLIADIKHKGVIKTVILDLKTSSIDYEIDSVITSPQLSLYKTAVGDEYKTDLCGFVVLKKQIAKNRVKICSVCGYDGSDSRHKKCNSEASGTRCNGDYNETLSPEVNYQIIIDKIPDQTEKIVMDNYEDIAANIKGGKFIRNFNSCEMAWGPCSYKKLCWQGDKSDLIQLPPSKK